MRSLTPPPIRLPAANKSPRAPAPQDASLVDEDFLSVVDAAAEDIAPGTSRTPTVPPPPRSAYEMASEERHTPIPTLDLAIDEASLPVIEVDLPGAADQATPPPPPLSPPKRRRTTRRLVAPTAVLGNPPVRRLVDSDSGPTPIELEDAAGGVSPREVPLTLERPVDHDPRRTHVPLRFLPGARPPGMVTLETAVERSTAKAKARRTSHQTLRGTQSPFAPASASPQGAATQASTAPAAAVDADISNAASTGAASGQVREVSQRATATASVTELAPPPTAGNPLIEVRSPLEQPPLRSAATVVSPRRDSGTGFVPGALGVTPNAAEPTLEDEIDLEVVRTWSGVSPRVMLGVAAAVLLIGAWVLAARPEPAATEGVATAALSLTEDAALSPVEPPRLSLDSTTPIESSHGHGREEPVASASHGAAVGSIDIADENSTAPARPRPSSRARRPSRGSSGASHRSEHDDAPIPEEEKTVEALEDHVLPEPAAAPVIPPVREPTPQSLLAEAREAFADQDYDQAFRSAMEGLEMKKSGKGHEEALRLVARSGCRVGHRELALDALRDLPLRERFGIRRECRREGERLGL